MQRHGAVAIALVLLSLMIYAVTMAPGLTWAHDGADGGDLAAAIASGGIPHPAGYPTYLLVGSVFATLPVGDLAYRLNLMSAVCAALTVGLVYVLVWQILTHSPGLGTTGGRSRGENGGSIRPLIAVAAALLFAFSPVFWSQAVITEVHTLNALFVALLLSLALSGRSGPGFWFVAGVGLGNHLSLLLLIPVLIVVGTPPAMGMGRPLPAGDSAVPWFGRLLRSVAALAAGLAVYLVLPARAMSDPLINWGDPRTLERFVWVVTGGPYRHYVFGLPIQELPARLAAWAQMLVQQYAWLGIVVILIGLWDMVERPTTRKLAMGLALGFGLYCLYAIGYRTNDSYLYMIPAYLIAVLWLGRGLSVLTFAVLSWAWNKARPLRPRPIVALLLVVFPAVQLAANWMRADVSDDQRARQFAQAVFTNLPGRSLLITASDEHIFSLWYQQAVTSRYDVLVLDRDLLQYSWYREQVRRRSPDLAVVPDNDEPASYVVSIIEQAKMQRDVFLVGNDEMLQQRFRWRPYGILNELVGPYILERIMG